MLLRWSVGLVIVLFSGWGFIALVAYTAYAHKLPLSDDRTAATLTGFSNSALTATECAR